MLPGERPPETYWAPWLAHHFSLRPADLGDMTPEQLHACAVFVEKSSKSNKKGR